MVKTKTGQHNLIKILKEGRVLFLIVAILFRASLDFSFIEIVSYVFEYEGFMIDLDRDKYLASWVFFFLLTIYLPNKIRQPSDCLIVVAFFTIITPIFVLFGLQNQNTWHTVLVGVQFLIIEIARKYKISQIPSLERYGKIIRYIIVISIIVGSVVIISISGVKNFNLDFDRVYEYRAETTASVYAGILGYFTVWVTNIFGGYLLIMTLERRNWVLSLLLLFLHVVWYGATSHKALVFYPILILFSYAMFRKSKYLFSVPLSLMLVVAVSLINYKITENIFASSMFIRRTFFVPPFMVYTYYDFFSENSLVYWSNSFLSGIVNYSYDENINLVIGRHLGQDNLWANVSFFATGFMHAGVLGVVVYGVICGLLLSVLDYAFRVGVQMWVVIALAIVPFHNLFTSADLGVSILTHGIGITMVLILSTQRSQKHEINRDRVVC
jgi:hypothetical protein